MEMWREGPAQAAQPLEVTPLGEGTTPKGRGSAWGCGAYWSRTNRLVITEGEFLFKEGGTGRFLSDLSHIFV